MGKKHKEPSECTLAELCNLIVTYTCPYEDVAEYLEDRAFTLAVRGRINDAVRGLTHITDFFERMVGKNEEICRDLADIYELIG
ncbi:MAG: hypothetical protein GF344_09990, partial [Chitinivibrionales bacterium]|nr:hypothetical protein [Chitinivibrionales bacterium]MBD3357164.1 hypothetical protein [Chitinivibrionales bacterium]